MPTRIALNKAASSTPLASSVGRSAFREETKDPEELSSDRSSNPPSTPRRKMSRKRSVVSFPSSLLREVSTQNDEVSLQSPGGNRMKREESDRSPRGDEKPVGLSSDDIRASPRLMGYLFAMTAGAVMLVSVVQFYRNEIDNSEQIMQESDQDIDIERYFVTATGLVFRWKMQAAVYFSAGALTLSLFTFLVHFDTVVLPRLWGSIFKDGTLAERNWILFLLVVWMITIHVSTSVLSVGEYQANVYFTAWIGFGAMLLNFGVWRDSAGLVTTETMIDRLIRQTTYNWVWTGFCSAVCAGAATDIYYNREMVQLRFRGEDLNLTESDWFLVLTVIWSEVALCCLVVALNEAYLILWQFPCRFNRDQGMNRFEFGWRQLEGLIILVSMAAKFWALLEYTGVDGIINGLNNAYFGLWGSFFNSVFALGTWMYENKKFDGSSRENAGNRH